MAKTAYNELQALVGKSQQALGLPHREFGPLLGSSLRTAERRAGRRARWIAGIARHRATSATCTGRPTGRRTTARAAAGLDVAAIGEALARPTTPAPAPAPAPKQATQAKPAS
jgi:hypothetical protein